MKLKFIIFILIAICFITLLTLILSTTTSLFTPANESETIKIGFVFPLSGELSMYGQSSKAALEYASDKTNNTINGKKIEFVFEDGKCEGKEATIAFNKLINIDKVNYIISGCSSETLAGAEIVKDKTAIIISPCSTTPLLKNTKNVFTVKPLDDFEGIFDAETIYNKLGKINIAILACENDWCQGIEKQFVKRFEELGGIILTIEHNKTKDYDFTTQLTKIKNENPELIVVFQYPEAFENIILQTKQLDINTKLYVPTLITKELVNKYYDELQGDYGSTSTTVLKDPNFEQELKSRTKMDIVDVDYCASSTYDTLMILKKAIESANSFGITKVKESLLKTEYDGIAGLHRFDAFGNQAIANFKIFQITGKELMELN